MQATTSTVAASKKSLRTGWIITAVLAAFLLFDGTTKVMLVPQVREAHARLGYSDSTTVGIGILLLVLTIILLIPRAGVLGTLLLTAYLGGATASHVRVGEPFYFPIFSVC